MDAHAERSKLIGRHKQERSDLEKKVKKLKGNMKTAAQEELDQLDKKHEAELQSFDSTEGTGKEKAPAKEAQPAAALPEGVDVNDLRVRNWNGLSKKELEECCTERGVSKKGAKEDLVMRLTIFHQDIVIKKKEAEAAAAAAEDEEEEEESEDEEARAKRKAEKKEKKAAKKEKKEKKQKKEEEEEEEGEEGEEGEEVVEKEEKVEKKAKKEKKEKKAARDEEAEEEEEEVKPKKGKNAARGSADEDDAEDEEEDSDDDDDDGPEVDEEEMEKQFKREKAVQTALRYLLTKKCPDGFPLAEFVAKLETINVKGFDPEKLGYRSLEKFVKFQPPNVLQYDKAKKFIAPPRRKVEES